MGFQLIWSWISLKNFCVLEDPKVLLSYISRKLMFLSYSLNPMPPSPCVPR